jgi:hypothetical protein
MLTTLLFIAIIISCKTYAKGFTKLSRFSRKTNLHARLTSTNFYDNTDDENDNRNKKYISNFNNRIQEEQHIIPNNESIDDNEPFYTLIWFDCEDCKNILRCFKNERKQLLYINGGYYFFDENDETSTPLFYKDDELIATDIFGIYEELFFKSV